jgi:shikimate dehydrogenase
MSEGLTDRYGVMGYPVSHSRSPIIHRLFALQTKQNLQYELLEVAPAKLEEAVKQFSRTGGKGLNITVPHKREVLRLVDGLSDRAKKAGAVNTLIFSNDEILGDNTDGVGLMRDLQSNIGVRLKDANILILGAGGATRGIIAPLLAAEPETIVIANRTIARAQELAEEFSADGPVVSCRFTDVGTLPVYDLIINATSAGVRGDSPPYPTAAIHKNTVCYDLSYGLTPTPFSKWGAEHGAARSVMGWGMLVEQAAESFFLWRGIRPDTVPVLKQLTVNIS